MFFFNGLKIFGITEEASVAKNRVIQSKSWRHYSATIQPLQAKATRHDHRIRPTVLEKGSIVVPTWAYRRTDLSLKQPQAVVVKRSDFW